MSRPTDFNEALKAGRFSRGLSEAATAGWQRALNMTDAERAERRERYAAEQREYEAWARSWRGRATRLRLAVKRRWRWLVSLRIVSTY